MGRRIWSQNIGREIAVSPWAQTVRTTAERPDDGSEQSDRLEVTVHDGYVYVTVTRPCTVRLFTILGNLVSQRNLPAGTSRLRLKGRGMYLLKTDRGTRRVTV